MKRESSEPSESGKTTAPTPTENSETKVQQYLFSLTSSQVKVTLRSLDLRHSTRERIAYVTKCCEMRGFVS